MLPRNQSDFSELIVQVYAWHQQALHYRTPPNAEIPVHMLDLFVKVLNAGNSVPEVGFQRMHSTTEHPFSGGTASRTDAMLLPRRHYLNLCHLSARTHAAHIAAEYLFGDDVCLTLCGIETSMISKATARQYRVGPRYAWALFGAAAVDGARHIWLRQLVDTPLVAIRFSGLRATIKAPQEEILKAIANADSSDLVTLEHGTRLSRRALRRLESFFEAVESRPFVAINTLEEASFKEFFCGVASLPSCFFIACMLPFAAIFECWLVTGRLCSGLLFSPDVDLRPNPTAFITDKRDAKNVESLFNSAPSCRMGMPNCLVPPEFAKQTFSSTVQFLEYIGVSSSQLARGVAGLPFQLSRRWARSPDPPRGGLSSKDFNSDQQGYKSLDASLPTYTPAQRRGTIYLAPGNSCSVRPQMSGATAVLKAKNNLLLDAAARHKHAAQWRSNRIGVLNSSRMRLRELFEKDASMWVEELRAIRYSIKAASSSELPYRQPEISSASLHSKGILKLATSNDSICDAITEKRNLTTDHSSEPGKFTLGVFKVQLHPISSGRAFSIKVGVNNGCDATVTSTRVQPVSDDSNRAFTHKPMRYSHPSELMLDHKSALVNTAQLLDKQTKCTKGASASVSLDSEGSFLEQSFVLRQHVLGGASWQSQCFSSLMARKGLDSRCAIQRQFLESMYQAGWTRKEGEQRLRYRETTKAPDANTAGHHKYISVEYNPPWRLQVFFQNVRVYADLNARLLRNNHVRILLRRDFDAARRPILNSFSRESPGRLRKIECFRHELNFVVDALASFDESCIEQAWRCFFHNLDVSDLETIAQSHNCFLATLSSSCGLNDRELEAKLGNVLQFASAAKDVTSQHVDQTRIVFLTLLQDLILTLDGSKDPTDLKVDLVGRLASVLERRPPSVGRMTVRPGLRAAIG